MQRLKRVFWIALAILVLIEAKLYDWTAPVFTRLMRLLALDRLKAWIARVMEPLPAIVVLVIFLVPLALAEPFKLIALWLIAEGHIITGVVTFALAEIVGLAAVVLLFDACRPKLMTIGWFAACYDWMMRAKAWALLQVEPLLKRARATLRVARRAIERRLARLFPSDGHGGFRRRLSWLRRKARTG